MEEAEMLKKVVLHSVATALANIVLPVPGEQNLIIILSIALCVCCIHIIYVQKQGSLHLFRVVLHHTTLLHGRFL